MTLTSVEHLASDGGPDDTDAGMTLAVTLPERSSPTVRRKHLAQGDTMTLQEIQQGRAEHQRAHGNYLAIPLAIRLMSQHRTGCVRPDGEPEPTCSDALGQHQSDSLCLASNP